MLLESFVVGLQAVVVGGDGDGGTSSVSSGKRILGSNPTTPAEEDVVVEVEVEVEISGAAIVVVVHSSILMARR